MAAAVVPGWTGAGGEADLAWNQCILGDVKLPGLIEVEGIEVGIDVETKKAKGADQPTSKDNGVKQSKFTIKVWLTQKEWETFQQVLPSINPRRPGRDRSPVQILQPGVNAAGIQNCRIVTIKFPNAPTARGGYRCEILCEEWFDKPKAPPKKKVEKPKDLYAEVGYNAAGLGLLNQREALREMSEQEIDPNNGRPLAPGSTFNLPNTLF